MHDETSLDEDAEQKKTLFCMFYPRLIINWAELKKSEIPVDLQQVLQIQTQLLLDWTTVNGCWTFTSHSR